MDDIPWGLVAPIAVIQIVLIVIALRDLIPRRRTNGPKWMWAILIVLFGIIGPVLYLTVGRKDD
ncbi:MAG: PLDc_N domain-containing protein [Bauldia sp.]|nr:PLDc_N domain-containing protein [Bauldia sp.]MCW5717525.1 PLDc_N domain-containing protein [Bauldia sp.]